MAIRGDTKTRSEDLLDYLRKNAQKGYSLESLKWALIKQGNSRADVEKAVAIIEKETSKSSIKPAAEQKITLEQSSFAEPVASVNLEKKPFWKRIFSSD